MAKKPQRPKDMNELAKLIVDISTGEKPNNPEQKQQWTKLAKLRKKPLN